MKYSLWAAPASGVTRKSTSGVKVLRYLRPLALCAAVLTCGAALRAADDSGAPSPDSPKDKKPQAVSSSSSSESEKPPIPRLWGGLSLNFTPLKLISTSSVTNANTGEVNSANQIGGLVGYGLNLNFRVTNSFSINLSGVYRRAGFNNTDTLYDSLGTVYTESVTAHNLDFPLLVRYSGSRFNISKYTFYELGGAFRYVSAEKLVTTAANSNGSYCCAPTNSFRFRKDIEGVVAGAGLIGRDDFGIIVAPEIRYTRWLANEYAGPSFATQRNQLEVAITFGY